MPLASAVFTLKDDLKQAFKDAKNSALAPAMEDSNASDPVTDALGEALGAAIHDYFMAAWVDISGVQSVAMPPVMCETIGVAPVRPVATGATIVPIIPVHHAYPGPHGSLYGVLK